MAPPESQRPRERPSRPVSGEQAVDPHALGRHRRQVLTYAPFAADRVRDLGHPPAIVIAKQPPHLETGPPGAVVLYLDRSWTAAAVRPPNPPTRRLGGQSATLGDAGQPLPRLRCSGVAARRRRATVAVSTSRWAGQQRSSRRSGMPGEGRSALAFLITWARLAVIPEALTAPGPLVRRSPAPPPVCDFPAPRSSRGAEPTMTTLETQTGSAIRPCHVEVPEEAFVGSAG